MAYHADNEVVIVGGGPTGLTLAAELALAGVETAIVERRANQDLAGARAGGLHARSIEMFDQRGIADRFLEAGKIAQVAGFAWIPLDISDFPTRHNYGLALWQNQIEKLLADWVAELRVPIHRNAEVVGVIHEEEGAQVDLADGRSFRAAYVVGCDGGRSLVRKSCGFAFPGHDPTVSHLIAEVPMTEEPTLGLHRDEHGLHGLSLMEDGHTVRVMITESSADRTDEPSLEDLSEGLIRIYGRDFGIHSPTWLSRFTDMTRQVEKYRNGRVLLAGDAAHVHYPAGGQGLNLGVQDAFNLGWKLAQVVKGQSSDVLLDSYHKERHPVGEGVLKLTMAQVALLRNDPRTDELREVVSGFLGTDEARRQLAGEMSGLDIRYDVGDGHPLVGRRMPDLDVDTASGTRRIYGMLHHAGHVLLNFGERGRFGHHTGSGQLRTLDARYEGTWDLPVLGTVDAPDAVLIRPDGYVAWVGTGSDSGLRVAMENWVGQA